MFIRNSILFIVLSQVLIASEMGAEPIAARILFTRSDMTARDQPEYAGTGRGMNVRLHRTGIRFETGTGRAGIEFDNMLATSYIEGSDPEETEDSFRAVIYRQVWRGVDVRLRSEEHRAILEFLVSTLGSCDDIRLRFTGDSKVLSDLLTQSGSPTGAISKLPVTLIRSNGIQTEIANGFLVEDRNGSFRVTAGMSDLQANPRFVYSGLLGGSGQSAATAVAIDSAFNSVVVGWTSSNNLPATSGARASYAGGIDAFVCSFTPTSQLRFCTYLGGAGDDRAFAVTVDAANNIYVAGWTSSSNFPLANPAQSKFGGARDAFVTKLSSNGKSILFSTYIGGTGVDSAYGITLDSGNAPIIVGDTTSSNMAGTAASAQPALAGGQDVFVAKLSPAGNAIVAATYFGGSAQDHGAAVKVDAANNVLIGGATYSTNMPVVKAFQGHLGGGQDGFVSAFSPDLKTLSFASYLGGSSGSPGLPEEVNAIALGPQGNLVVGGTTSSSDFPVLNATVQTSFGGGSTDGFIARINVSTGTLLSSMFFGGNADDGINAIAVDFYTYIYIGGYTNSTGFPVQNAQQPSPSGGMDGFVAKLTLAKVVFSTYLGGQGSDAVNGLAIDSMTSVVVAGSTMSSNFPTAQGIGAWQGAAESSFLTKIAPSFQPTLAAEPTLLFDVWHDSGLSGTTVTLQTGNFGQTGDIPVAGDWDGSGVKRIGVFRNGVWLLDINGNGVFDAGDKTISFGQTGDLPVIGDWTGTGTIKLGLFRSGTFILDLSGHLAGVSTGLSDAVFSFGQAGDIPVAKDWNGSGATKVGVFRAGQWLVDYNGDRVFNGLDQTYTFGQAGDLPVIGDWDSSGMAKIGVYRNGLWILDYGGINKLAANPANQFLIGFGAAGYLPLVM